MTITLEQLYSQTKGWTGRHIVQDEIMSCGKGGNKEIASDYIIAKVAEWEAKETN